MIDSIKPFEEKILNGGTQQVYHFENGYGASVICSPISYGYSSGLKELAVLAKTGDNWNITYDTPITDDVLGHLTQKEVDKLLNKIQKL